MNIYDKSVINSIVFPFGFLQLSRLYRGRMEQGELHAPGSNQVPKQATQSPNDWRESKVKQTSAVEIKIKQIQNRKPEIHGLRDGSSGWSDTA